MKGEYSPGRVAYEIVDRIIGERRVPDERLLSPGHGDRLLAVLERVPGEVMVRCKVFDDYSFLLLHTDALDDSGFAKRALDAHTLLPLLARSADRARPTEREILAIYNRLLDLNLSITQYMTGSGGIVERVPVQAATVSVGDDHRIFIHFHQPVISLLAFYYWDQVNDENIRLLMGFQYHWHEIDWDWEGLLTIRVQGDLALDIINLHNHMSPARLQWTSYIIEALPTIATTLDQEAMIQVHSEAREALLEEWDPGQPEQAAARIASRVMAGLLGAMRRVLDRLPRGCPNQSLYQQAISHLAILDLNRFREVYSRTSRFINNIRIHEGAVKSENRSVTLHNIVSNGRPIPWETIAIRTSRAVIVNPPLAERVTRIRLYNEIFYNPIKLQELVEVRKGTIPRNNPAQKGFKHAANPLWRILAQYTLGLVPSYEELVSNLCLRCPPTYTWILEKAVRYSCVNVLGDEEPCRNALLGEKYITMPAPGGGTVIIDYTIPYRIIAGILLFTIINRPDPCVETGVIPWDRINRRIVYALNVGDHTIEIGGLDFAMIRGGIPFSMASIRLDQAADALEEGLVLDAAAYLLMAGGREPVIRLPGRARAVIMHPHHRQVEVIIPGNVLVRPRLLAGIPYRVDSGNLRIRGLDGNVVQAGIGRA